MSAITLPAPLKPAMAWFLHGKGSGPFRIICFTALAMHIMKYAERSASDPALWVTLIAALFMIRRAPLVWRSTAGLLGIGVLVWALVSIVLSVEPALSGRDFVKQLDILAAAFAIPIVLNTRSRVEKALLIASLAWTIVLGYHLIEMHRELGTDLVQKAHDYRPAAMVHANIESMIAGLAVFALAHGAWVRRARIPIGILLSAASLFNLFYIYVIASRGPQIAFAATFVLSGFVMLHGWRLKTAWAVIILACGLAIATNLEKINERFSDIGSLDSLNGRDVVWAHTWELSKARAWLGHGYGKRVFVETYHHSDPPRSPFDFQHPHQYWLYVFFSQGAIGVMLHIAFWIALLSRVLRAFRESTREEDRLLIGLLGLLLVYIQTYSLADWPGSVLWVILLWLVSLTMSATRPNDTRPEPHGESAM
ncbi:MAG: hypothetical protein O2923_10485 [Verrucomicrobia bacterium]|nr:hypothetical protein [Verrucomicrobiota bacterium]MDA1088063.1 hypothetical protein [Verrucomicrobiota bacterium]